MKEPTRVEFILRLFDDESVRKKLTILDNMEVMFDDERNSIPNEYWELVGNLKPGESIRITVEKVKL